MTETKEVSSLVGKKFRFVVSSAEEAVRVIKTHLGDNAKVLEVNQIGGKGLSKFISSPKLEVIATIPPPEPPKVPTAPPQPVNTPQPPAPPLEQQASPEQKPNVDSSVLSILERIGFHNTLLTNLKSSSYWLRLKHHSVSHGLFDVTEWLRAEYQKVPSMPLDSRVAFLGASGVGKTTALCKSLSREVFIHNRTVQVIHIDSDTPNFDSSLKIFCDVLGVPMLKDPIDMDLIQKEQPLYIDAPGFSSNDNQVIRNKLDQLEVKTRILVLNSLYDAEYIKKSVESAKHWNATHIIFTHADELQNFGKLWFPILYSGLSPLFFSNGQSLTSDRLDNILGCLLERTFMNLL